MKGGSHCTEPTREAIWKSWALLFCSEFDFKSLEDGSAQCDAAEAVTGHAFFRHAPGTGSRPMVAIVHRDFRDMIHRVTWDGRAGAVHLQSRVCSRVADDSMHGAGPATKPGSRPANHAGLFVVMLQMVLHPKYAQPRPGKSVAVPPHA